MIQFPWQFNPAYEHLSDFALSARPRSLPPLDTTFDGFHFNSLGDEMSKAPGEDLAVDASPVYPFDPEETQAKIDQLLQRMNAVTTEQAKLQRDIQGDPEDMQTKIAGLPEAIIARAVRRGHAPSPSHDSEIAEEEIGLAKTTNVAQQVSRSQVQTITVVSRKKSTKSRRDAPQRRQGLYMGPVGSAVDGSEDDPAGRKSPFLATAEKHIIEEALNPRSISQATSYESDKASTVVLADSPTLSRAENRLERADSDARSSYFGGRQRSKTASARSSPMPSPSLDSQYTISPTLLQRQNLRIPDSLPAPPIIPAARSSHETPPSSPGGYSSFGKIPPRAIHTSCSTHSTSSAKVKAFMSFPNESDKKRDSDDSVSIKSEKRARKLADMDERERSFEELVNSGATLHCTIATADPTRDVNTPDLATVIKTATYEPPKLADDPRPFSKASSKPSIAKPLNVARDARVDDSQSARELALFLRSTGPPESSSTRVNTSQSFKSFGRPGTSKAVSSGASVRSNARTLTTSHSQSTPITPITPISPFSHQLPVLSRTSTLGSTMTAKTCLVAREANVVKDDTTSDLADFFRSTKPPVSDDKPNGISFARPGGGQTDYGTKHVSLAPSMETHSSRATDTSLSSFNSNASLLRRKPSVTEFLGSSSNNHSYGISNNDGMPTRTRRRVRDPYAIDDEDEDELNDDDGDSIFDAYHRPPPKREAKEESLADFLRNATPPPATQPSATSPVEEKRSKPRTASISLMTRLGRTPSRKGSISSPVVITPTHRPLIPDAAPNQLHFQTAFIPSDTPNAGGTVITTPVAVSPVSPIQAAMGGRYTTLQRHPPSRGGGAARMAPVGESASLAEFLRSGPPPGFNTEPVARPTHKEESGSRWNILRKNRRKVEA